MAKLGKRMRLALEKVEPMKEYELIEAVSLAKEAALAKFDESVDVAVRLGVE
jgi:large subunit ribosomal protein L1